MQRLPCHAGPDPMPDDQRIGARVKTGSPGGTMSTVDTGTQDALRTAQELIFKAAEAGDLDQRRAPMLEALRAFHESDAASFSIPAHKAGRALDELTRDILGEGPYRADAPAHKGLDDRVFSLQGAVARAAAGGCRGRG